MYLELGLGLECPVELELASESVTELATRSSRLLLAFAMEAESVTGRGRTSELAKVVRLALGLCRPRVPGSGISSNLSSTKLANKSMNKRRNSIQSLIANHSQWQPGAPTSLVDQDIDRGEFSAMIRGCNCNQMTTYRNEKSMSKNKGLYEETSHVKRSHEEAADLEVLTAYQK